jgi:hypothetical protein
MPAGHAWLLQVLVGIHSQQVPEVQVVEAPVHLTEAGCLPVLQVELWTAVGALRSAMHVASAFNAIVTSKPRIREQNTGESERV